MDTKKEELVGGCYVIENGVRRLVEEPTADHPEGNRAREANGTPVPPAGTEAGPAAEPEQTTRRARRGSSQGGE